MRVVKGTDRKSLSLYLLVIGCVLASVCSSAASTNISFGTVVAGSITSSGQSNSYTFSGNVNEVVDFTTVATSGSLSPEIQLYNPSGTLIASASNRNGFGDCIGGAVIELDAVTLLVSGTYTVTISDCSNTNTGNYNLYAQGTNQPSGAGNLPFGRVQSGSINSAAQDNTYTFSANANDVADFTMVTTNGNLSPRIRLYSPAGALLKDAANRNGFGDCIGGSVTELNTVTLTTSGTYTVLVGDCSDTNSGNYNLYSQRTNNPSGAQSLPFDETPHGTISSVAQSITYTFSASANDVIDFSMVTTSGSLSPRIRLYSPTGALLGDAANRNGFGNCIGGSVIELNTVTLATSGRYTVLVGDCSDVNTGNYDIYAQLTQDPLGAGDLSFGQTQTGTVSSQAQDNTYTFGANANDMVDFTVVTTSGSLSPRIRVYNSAGALLADAANRNGFGDCIGGSVVELNTVSISLSDTYTILVGDCSDTNTGSYVIYSQLTNQPFGAATLLFNQTQTGNIASVAQDSSYVFSGSTSDVVDFTMVTTSGSLSPRIRLYSPTGTLLKDVANRNGFGNCIGGSVTELNAFTLPSSGTYVALVGDCSDTLTGNYVIYGQRTNSPFGPSPLLFGGQTQSGSITSASQSNTFIFGGSTNNVLDFTMVATSGTLSPRIRLYSPSGALLDDVANRNGFGTCTGGSTITLNSVTLTANGIYTVLTGDCSDTNTGNYNLSTLCFGTCLVMPAITWANPAPINYGTPLGSTQLDATFSVPGTPSYNPLAGTVLLAGPQNLSVTFTPSDTSQYSTAEDSVQLTVNSTVVIRVSPSSLNFGQQVINTISTARKVTLTNSGTAAVSIYAIIVGDDYTISANTCGTSLGVGAQCSVSVVFRPSQLRSVIGTLTIIDSAPNSPQAVSLFGSGVEPATLTPGSYTFGTQQVGTTSPPATFTLTNNQTSTLTGIAISTATPFAVSSTTCTTTLAANSTCTISVTFTPTQTGTVTGSLSVSDSANNSPQRSGLIGTGD